MTIEYASGYTVSSAIIIDANGTRNITMESVDGKYVGSIEARIVGESQIVVELEASGKTLIRVSNATVLEPVSEAPSEQPGEGEAPTGGLGDMTLILVGIAIVVIVAVGVLLYLRKRG